jgi:mannitol/fructose-specific phosphotransferase system IIA component (Ntr-type)/mannose/fructose-specific phosphotransferase system component IIA
LDEPLNSAYNKAAAVIKDANRGKGVLLLMDMGSSLNLGHRFTEETGIVTRTISRVDTVMVIDAARRALIPEADIDDIVESLAAEKNIKSVSEKLREDNKKATIISLCLTGEGTAKYIHDMISSEVVKLDPGIEILDVGLLSDEDPIARIDSLRRDREILLIVGTINPHHPELTFYSATSMLKHGDTSDFGRLLAVEYTRRNQEKVIVKDHGTINAIFDEGFLMVDTPIEDKDELLEVMCGMLNDRGRVTKDYLQGVKMHEEISVTALGNGIAIPHGRPEDIIIPTVGVATLKTPIVWSDGMEVSLVLLLALNGDAKNEFPSIFRLLKDNSILKKITGAKSAEEIMKVIKSS